MIIKLLALLTVENYHPFYKLSTKTPEKEIILDGVIELTNDYEVSYLGDIDDPTPTMVSVHDNCETPLNKDWLIRAKREKLKELQYKFYRRDE